MDALGAKVIPSPTAAGDFTRRFGEGDVIELQEAFNAVRPVAGPGRDLLAPVAYVDVDGTLAPTLGDKKAMDMQGGVGLPPAGHLAQHGQVLYLVNRPGNVVSHEGAAEWYRPRGAPRRTGVRARGHGLLADDFDRGARRRTSLRLRLATGSWSRGPRLWRRMTGSGWSAGRGTRPGRARHGAGREGAD